MAGVLDTNGLMIPNGGGYVRVTRNGTQSFDTGCFMAEGNINPGYGFHIPGTAGALLYLAQNGQLFLKNNAGEIYLINMTRVNT